MDKELNFFRELFLWLYDQSHRSYADPQGDIQTIVSDTYRTHRPITDRATLERCLPNKEREQASFADLGVFLYLRPPERASRTVPVISAMCDFGRSLPEVRVQLLLFLLDGDGNLQSLGYRFETPEGPGRHNFYHIQPIRTLFGTTGTPPTTCPPWFPDTHPTFPIDATDAVSLPFNLLISLYGPACAELNPVALNPTVRDHLSPMLCLKPKAVRYWRVASRRHAFHYESWFEPRKFRTLARERHRGNFEISEIDYTQYSALPANERQRW
jgi:hypothetical protein